MNAYVLGAVAAGAFIVGVAVEYFVGIAQKFINWFDDIGSHP